MAQIFCKDLSIGYDSKIIISNINIDVNVGDYLCIVGENGSGKSTLIRTILGLQPPISGDITFSDNLKTNKIGYLSQQTDIQRDFPASVKEIVISGFQGKCGIRPFYKNSEKIQALKAIEKIGLKGFENRCYRELSGGQQQRVLLARALCATSKLLFLDEPISGLDPKATSDMYRLIDDLNKKDKITIIMISHDVDTAVKYASHILHIGKKIFFGTKSQYQSTKLGRTFVKEQEV